MTKNSIPEGTQFGQLTVLQHTERRSGYNHYFLARCDCGREIELLGSHLLHSGVTSCGCARPVRQITVDSTERRLRQAWRHMISRCTDSGCKDYCNYGARGISVCLEWLTDFNTFKDWSLSHGYQDNLSLDRIDNDGIYEPGNCQWATIVQQNRNTRRVRRVTAFSETKTLSEWAADPRCQVTYFALRQRVTYLGWEIETAIMNGKHKRSQVHAA